MKFSLTIPASDIAAAKNQAIDSFVAKTTLKGFRPGKAPRQAVIDHISEEKIFSATVNKILPDAYIKEVKKQKYQPITFPKFTPKAVKPDTDWEFEVEIAEKPTVTLGDYQSAIKGALAKEKIWIPGKDLEPGVKTDQPHNHDDHEGHDHHEQDKKISLIFETLLKTCQLEIPELLVEDEVNHRLSTLIDQLTKVGMNIDAYLKSKNTTAEALKAQYQKETISSLKLEFIVDAITKDLNIDVTNQEIDSILKQSQSPAKLGPSELANLRAVIIRRKTIDRLLALAT